MVDLIDTHCHLHEIEEALTPTHERWFADKQVRTADGVLDAAWQDGVRKVICIGTSLADSELAVKFAATHENAWASIGIHPHEAKEHRFSAMQERFAALADAERVVAVGECGLDYYYNLSPKQDQEALLRFQIELALKHDLPLSFHVRDAFDDFWPIFDEYEGVRGVLHSFTDTRENLEKGLGRGLYIGVNGIATFARDEAKTVINRTIPLDRLLFETDAPYLTPHPYRGRVCEPKHVRVTAEYLAELRSISLEEIARITTANAKKLFRI